MPKTFCNCGHKMEYDYIKPIKCTACGVSLSSPTLPINVTPVVAAAPIITKPTEPVKAPSFTRVQVSINNQPSSRRSVNETEADNEEKTEFTTDIVIQDLGVQRESFTLGEIAVGNKSNLARQIKRSPRNHKSFTKNLFSNKPIEL